LLFYYSNNNYSNNNFDLIHQGGQAQEGAEADGGLIPEILEIPPDPFGEEIVVNTVSFFIPGDEVLFEQTLDSRLNRTCGSQTIAF
jgi:hypothetical protein